MFGNQFATFSTRQDRRSQNTYEDRPVEHHQRFPHSVQASRHPADTFKDLRTPLHDEHLRQDQLYAQSRNQPRTAYAPAIVRAAAAHSAVTVTSSTAHIAPAAAVHHYEADPFYGLEARFCPPGRGEPRSDVGIETRACPPGSAVPLLGLKELPRTSGEASRTLYSTPIAKVFRTVWRAIRNRFKYGDIRRTPHWMDHALDDHDCSVEKACLTDGRCATASFVEDIKQLFRIVIMMLPVPVFWSLYDQQGSKWLLQAIAMDGKVTDGWTILPDQMSAANAILTMVFIPIFQFIVYPLVEAVGIRVTPLRKMVAGGVLASLCFVAAGALQIAVNQTVPDPPQAHEAFLSVINGFPTECSIVVNGIPGIDASRPIQRNSSLVDDKVAGITDLLRIDTIKTPVISPLIEFQGACNGHSRVQYRIELEAANVYWLFVGPEAITSSTTKLDKPTKGEGESGLSLALLMPCAHVPALLRTSDNCPSVTSTYNGPLALCLVEGGDTDTPCNPRNPKKYYQWTVEGTDINVLNASLFTGNGDDTSSGSAVSYATRDVQPGRYRLYYINDTLRGQRKPPRNADELSAAPVGVEIEITGMGGVYLLVASTAGNASDSSNTTVIHTTHTVVPRNHMSILWQLPLYVIITMAETLFAISGYEFAYSQTAPSLKTVTQAIWLLTIGLGDAIIILITLINTLDLAKSDFIFAGGMLLVIGIFALMSVYYYDYVDADETKSDVSALVSREVSIKDEDRVVKL